MQQLDSYLTEKQFQKISAVLDHLRPGDCPALESKSWILGRSKDCFPPAKVFFPGSQLRRQPLHPYLDEIDDEFASKRYSLLKASNVRLDPSVEDLFEIQNGLLGAEQEHLSPSNLQPAVAILEIAVALGYDCTNLLVPDTTFRLRKITDIVHGVPFGAGEQSGFNFTHRDISDAPAQRLHIATPSERAISLDIDLGSMTKKTTPHQETVVSSFQPLRFFKFCCCTPMKTF